MPEFLVQLVRTGSPWPLDVNENERWVFSALCEGEPPDGVYKSDPTEEGGRTVIKVTVTPTRPYVFGTWKRDDDVEFDLTVAADCADASTPSPRSPGSVPQPTPAPTPATAAAPPMPVFTPGSADDVE